MEEKSRGLIDINTESNKRRKDEKLKTGRKRKER